MCHLIYQQLWAILEILQPDLPILYCCANECILEQCKHEEGEQFCELFCEHMKQEFQIAQQCDGVWGIVATKEKSGVPENKEKR